MATSYKCIYDTYLSVCHKYIIFYYYVINKQKLYHINAFMIHIYLCIINTLYLLICYK